MRKKYKMIRVPEEAYNDFNEKKMVLNKISKEENINKNISLADTLRYFSSKKIFIPNEEMKFFIKKKKTKWL